MPRKPKRHTSKALSKVEKKEVRKIVKKEIEEVAELKWFVEHFANLETTDVHITSQDLTEVDQEKSGDDSRDNLRIGDQIYLRDFLTTYSFELPSGNGLGSTWLNRVVFVQWKDTSASFDVAKIFLYDPAIDGDMTISPYSQYTTDYAGQYHILYDKIFPLSSQTSTAMKSVTMRLKNYTRKIQYLNGTITGFNHIYVIAMSTHSDNDWNPLFDVTTKLRFNDM